MISSRKSYDAYFLDIAQMVATRATCPRLAVGAVLVREQQIIATGYNGAPAGLPHCTEVGCKLYHGHCIASIHAEANAVAQAGRLLSQGATLYCTHAPCWECAKLVINAGVIRVVYATRYENDKRREHDPVELFKAVGIPLVQGG